ncbi:MAG: hypothetical protein AMXMBFR80_09590 [Dehalococcoidia bacterium]
MNDGASQPTAEGPDQEGLSAGELAAISDFCSDGTHWDYLWRRVGTGLAAVRPDVQRAVACALGYRFAREPTDEQRRLYGPFEPCFIFDDRASAPPLPEVDDATKTIWAEVFELVPQPAVKARLGDLLWSVRYGARPHQFALAGIDAYRALGGDTWPPTAEESGPGGRDRTPWGTVRRAECLRRAMELALEINDGDRVEHCAGALFRAATECKANNAAIGALFLLLAALVRLRPAQRPSGTRDLVMSTFDAFRADIFQVSQMTDLAVQIAESEEERRQLRAAQVRAYADAADAVTGIERALRLQEALELARTYSVPLVEELRGRLDQLGPDTTGLGKISVPIDIPADELEAEVVFFVRDDWKESLRVFATSGGTPPSGDADKNRAFVQELREQAPLQFIIPTVITNAQGRVVDRANTDEEHDRLALLRQESLRISLWGWLTQEILSRALAERPSHDELTAFFTTELIRPEIAERVAKALGYYLDGRFDESAHLLVPRIEAVVRDLALAAGVPVAREPFGAEPGGVATLGALLYGLGGRFDESWLRYLQNTLVEPGGLNLRNRICHGLLDQCGPLEAGILIHVACFLATLRVSPPPPAA